MKNSDKVYIRIWEFQVKSGKEEGFERSYGPHGDWVQLFRKSDGFLKTELHRDLNDHGRYVTVDYFKSKADFEKILTQFKEEYNALDRSFEGFTTSEHNIGVFEVV